MVLAVMTMRYYKEWRNTQQTDIEIGIKVVPFGELGGTEPQKLIVITLPLCNFGNQGQPPQHDFRT